MMDHRHRLVGNKDLLPRGESAVKAIGAKGVPTEARVGAFENKNDNTSEDNIGKWMRPVDDSGILKKTVASSRRLESAIEWAGRQVGKVTGGGGSAGGGGGAGSGGGVVPNQAYLKLNLALI